MILFYLLNEQLNSFNAKYVSTIFTIFVFSTISYKHSQIAITKALSVHTGIMGSLIDNDMIETDHDIECSDCMEIGKFERYGNEYPMCKNCAHMLCDYCREIYGQDEDNKVKSIGEKENDFENKEDNNEDHNDTHGGSDDNSPATVVQESWAPSTQSPSGALPGREHTDIDIIAVRGLAANSQTWGSAINRNEPGQPR